MDLWGVWEHEKGKTTMHLCPVESREVATTPPRIFTPSTMLLPNLIATKATLPHEAVFFVSRASGNMVNF
jgi:hypothetical protein